MPSERYTYRPPPTPDSTRLRLGLDPLRGPSYADLLIRAAQLYRLRMGHGGFASAPPVVVAGWVVIAARDLR